LEHLLKVSIYLVIFFLINKLFKSVNLTFYAKQVRKQVFYISSNLIPPLNEFCKKLRSNYFSTYHVTHRVSLGSFFEKLHNFFNFKFKGYIFFLKNLINIFLSIYLKDNEQIFPFSIILTFFNFVI